MVSCMLVLVLGWILLPGSGKSIAPGRFCVIGGRATGDKVGGGGGEIEPRMVRVQLSNRWFRRGRGGFDAGCGIVGGVIVGGWGSGGCGLAVGGLSS